MSTTNRLWRITGLIGLLSTVVLVTGMIYGAKTVLYPNGKVLPESGVTVSDGGNGAAVPKDRVQILALGDSLTKGVGDDRGEGYVLKLKKKLESGQGKPVYVWNFAVNGAKTADLLAELAKPSTIETVKQANTILFTIGGNDLNQVATVVNRPGGNTASQTKTPESTLAPTSSSSDLPEELSFNFEELAKQLPEAVKRLNDIIDKLSELNPEAQIVYIGLYHPFAEFDPDRQAAAWIGKWNDAAFQAANRHNNVTVVPTYDLFQNHWQSYLFTDHFHPNGDAYTQIAERVAQVLK